MTKRRSTWAMGWLLVCTVALPLVAGCLVDERCSTSAECRAPAVCLADGTCGFECTGDAQCGARMRCAEHRCRPSSGAPLSCPADMVSVADAFCVDRFEASRSDATELDMGQASGGAMSRAGVLPWQLAGPNEAQTAAEACAAVGKSLCTPQQWRAACEGSAQTAYGYGPTYESRTCNGIDTYSPSEPRLATTGHFAQCKSDWGAYDMNGNLWEHTLGGSTLNVRGGAFNCRDSASLHRCDYIPGTWEPSARGFRCCLVPATPVAPPDAGLEDLPVELDDATTEPDGEVGCLDDVAEDGQSSDVDPSDVSADLPRDLRVDVSVDGVGDDFGEDLPVLDTAPDAAPSCGENAVLLGGVCVDRYEASHADSSATEPGSSPVASSRSGVLPWFPVTLPIARSACEMAGKRLCALDTWIEACAGPEGRIYSYGDVYDPVTCNGIDSHCRCSDPVCSEEPVCPYAHCFNRASAGGGGPCGAAYHVEPTGSREACQNGEGVYDITGNVWELTDSDDGLEHFRGGAYNCSDSEALHRCDHDGTWGPSAKGFRCCSDPH